MVAAVTQRSSVQGSRTRAWGGAPSLLPVVVIAPAVIAGRCSSWVAMRTPSYLISGTRCLCHSLKEMEFHGLR